MFKWPIVTLCTALTFVVVLAFRENTAYTLVAVALLGVVMLAASWSWEHFVVYVVLFLIGIGMEILMVHVGVWSYLRPSYFGVPLWIPFIWSNAGLFVIELKEVVDARLQKMA